MYTVASLLFQLWFKYHLKREEREERAQMEDYRRRGLLGEGFVGDGEKGKGTGVVEARE
jgi:hypothetical protein